MIIENIPVEKPNETHGLTSYLFKLKIGQSVLVDTTYGGAKSCIRAAKSRMVDPLDGEFRVVKESGKVRVGRVE